MSVENSPYPDSSHSESATETDAGKDSRRVPTVSSGALDLQKQIMNIHSALSNSDSLRIFNLAATGIDASTSVLQKHQFTKKRYYGRLKELVDLGLIYKNSGEYKHTAVGSAIFQSQVKNLEQILLGTGATSDNGHPISDIFEAREQPLSNEALVESHRNDARNISFFSSWNELSSEVALKIETAKEEIFAATRYVDFRTAEAAISAAKRGCYVNIIHSSRSGFSPKLQVMGNLMAHPKALSIFKEMTSSPNITVAEVPQLPYSFMVIDATRIGIEIVNSDDPYTFFFGLGLEDHSFASKLITHFKALARTAEKDTIASLMESEQGMLAKAPQRSD
jgi:hypothetical protein